ncbi:hypothetical protein ACA910_000917 [Epithemia clementina (nom. ined.)]
MMVARTTSAFHSFRLAKVVLISVAFVSTAVSFLQHGTTVPSFGLQHVKPAQPKFRQHPQCDNGGIGRRSSTSAIRREDVGRDQEGKISHPCYRFIILGGAGKIGTAAACHLLLRAPSECQVVLVGRRRKQGKAAIQQVWNEYRQMLERAKTGVRHSKNLSTTNVKPDEGCLKFVLVNDVWDSNDPMLRQLLGQKNDELSPSSFVDCLIHTAGPFLDRDPTPLKLATEFQCPVYVDISDPIPFLEQSLQQNEQAVQSGTTALLAGGAFPGMSNVLAMEAAAAASAKKTTDDNPIATSSSTTTIQGIQDVRFAYYTAGLGGSGPLNLYITNLGFGEPMVQFDQGKLRYYKALSGRLLGNVDFFLPGNDDNKDFAQQKQEDGFLRFGNPEARARVGTRQVFAWPFPEAATVPTELQAQGNSWACMGTAPELWNVMLGILVDVIPRAWWRNSKFSQFMADFSQPLVWLSDQILKWTDVNQIGETHAMRIDVTAAADASSDSGSNANHPYHPKRGISIVQAHDSFRQCVGQSCAEFALDCLFHPETGVRLPEQRYCNVEARSRIIANLVSTPGTFCYTGPVPVQSIAAPTNIAETLAEAIKEEAVNSFI